MNGWGVTGDTKDSIGGVGTFDQSWLYIYPAYRMTQLSSVYESCLHMLLSCVNTCLDSFL